MKYLVIVLIAFMMNSCIVFHSGNITSGPLLSTNDKYVDIASGTSKSVFVLGFGDIKRNALIREAKKNLYLKRPIAMNEYYSNFTVDINKKIILFVAECINVTVSADILKSGESGNAIFEESFYKKIAPPIKHKQIDSSGKIIYKPIIANGDSVYYSYDSKDYNLFIVSSIDKETVLLNATTSSSKNLLLSVKSNFFIKNISVNSFRNGDKISVETLNTYNAPVIEKGEIFGFSDDETLIKTGKGFVIVPTIKLRRQQ